MQAWTIIRQSTGEVLYGSLLTEDDQHPTDCGWVADPDHEFIPLDKPPVLGLDVWTGEGWEPDPEVVKERLCTRVNEALVKAFAKGFVVPAGPLAGETLQVRDNDDKTNWLTSQAEYSLHVANGDGATEGAAFRTLANETRVISYQHGLEALMMMAAWGKTLMGISWAKKDAIRAGDLSVDPDAGWP